MERNKEARRAIGAMNGGGGGGLLRRRQRNGGYGNSPEDDGGLEIQESGRLRDRGSKKDRDRDRSGRSKRRRGDRILLSSNREEGEDTSEDTYVEDEEEEEEASVVVRLPHPPPPPPVNHAPPHSVSQNHHRNSFPMTAKAARIPAVWKSGDEMIGVSVPRKARTSSVKRSQDFSSCGGGNEQIHRQASTSPARPSPSSASQISPSPSSSSAPARKKMKPNSGSKHRPPKISKSSSVSEDMEMVEVAEVLFELNRQFQPPETNKFNTKDTDGSSNEIKQKVSSSVTTGSNPPMLDPSNPSSSTTEISSLVPKLKRPPAVKSDEKSAANPACLPALPSTSASSAAKNESEQSPKAETSSPRSEKDTKFPVVENGGHRSLSVSQVATMAPTGISVHQESVEPENKSLPELKVSAVGSDGRDQAETKQEANSFAKEIPPSDLDVNMIEGPEAEAVPAAENTPKSKLSIDLMVPPPGRSSLEMEGLSDYVSTDHNAEDTKIQLATTGKIQNTEGEMDKTTKREADEVLSQVKNAGNCITSDYDMKKHITEEKKHDLQLDFVKHDKDGLECNKQQAQKQPSKAAKMGHRTDIAEQSAPLLLPTNIPGWPGRPGSFPSLGYMGHVPPVQAVGPVEGSAGSSKSVQRPNFLSAQLRRKRCATHCYIAHNIHYHQQLSRMNPFWPAAAGPPQLYGAKPCDPNVAKHYNLNATPPMETSILGNPLQGNIPARNLGLVQEKAGQLPTGCTSLATKENPQAGNPFTDATQRKQLVLQQVPQSGSAANMLHGPTFIFPINQQQAAAAPSQSGTSKPMPVTGNGNAVASSSSASSVVGSSGVSGLAATMSFNYPLMPTNEAQYIAMLQNGGYPFPIPAVGAPPTYRGGIAAQSVPFFNGHFYSSQMLHPQLQQQQQQQQQQQTSTHQPPSQQPSHSHTRKGHQNPSTSSGSSSSHKPQQQSQRAAGGCPTGTPGSSIQGFPASKQQQQHHLPTQCEMGSDKNPSTADCKIPQAQKNIYGHNLAMAIHPQNFALISPAAAAALSSCGVNHNEKQQSPPRQQQQIKVDLTTSQAFAMSFPSPADGATAMSQGLDFSSSAQNHAVFQDFPDAAKHGYHISVAAAAAAAAVAQASQHRKSQNQNAEDGKSTGDSVNTSTAEEDRKMKATSKPVGCVPQNSINFSRSDNDSPRSTVVGNNVNNVIESSSRTLNLIQAQSSNGSRLSNRPASTAPATSGSATASAPSSTQLQQQQQHLIQLQKLHQQQQLQLQNQFGNRNTKTSTPATSTTMYSDRLPSGSTMSKFPQALAGFPQAFMQGAGAMQTPHWKTSTRASAPVPTPSSSKSQLSQLQGRALQQPVVMPCHQTQISFGVSSSKSAVPAGQQQHLSVGGSSNASPSAPVGSPQSSVSKSAGGSPRASSSAKPSAMQLQQQPSGKNSPSSSSNLKSSALSNSSTPSILGHAPMTKHQQQQPQSQQLQKQPVGQAQIFFSNAYLQAQPSPSSGPLAATGYYHQRRRSEDSEQSSQQQGQVSSTPGSTRMLSQCPTTMALTGIQPTSTELEKATSAAALAASNMKSVPGMLQHPAQFVSHPYMTAAAAAAAVAFPYIQTVQPVLVKPSGEQKPAAGNDNLHISWQPEKR